MLETVLAWVSAVAAVGALVAVVTLDNVRNGPDIRVRIVRGARRGWDVHLIISNEGRTAALDVRVAYHNIKGRDLPTKIDQLNNGQEVYRPIGRPPAGWGVRAIKA